MDTTLQFDLIILLSHLDSPLPNSPTRDSPHHTYLYPHTWNEWTIGPISVYPQEKLCYLCYAI